MNIERVICLLMNVYPGSNRASWSVAASQFGEDLPLILWSPELQSVTSDIRHNVSNEIPPMVLPEREPVSSYWWVHPTKYVNSAKYKIFKNHKKILRSPTVFKTKRKNIDRYITFYFLLYLLWIVQVSRELLSSQWKPPSFLVETVTLKSSHFGKRPYAWNQTRTTFSGPSVSNILRVGSQGPPGHDIVPVLHNPSNEWASNLCFTDWGHTLYDKQLGAWIPHYLVGCTLIG